ncbi:glutathione S-transferase family protein [Rickettsiales bacterium LUAb2]
MLTLVGSLSSPYVNKVSALLWAKNIKYKHIHINLDKKPDWFIEKSPFGKVPLLILENEKILFESDAICEYIDYSYDPKLLADDLLEKTDIKAACYTINNGITLTVNMLFSKDKAYFKLYLIKLQQLLKNLENLITDEKYMINNKLSMADIYLAVMLIRLKYFENHTKILIFSNLTKLSTIAKHLLNTSWLLSSLPENYEDKFIKLIDNKVGTFINKN